MARNLAFHARCSVFGPWGDTGGDNRPLKAASRAPGRPRLAAVQRRHGTPFPWLVEHKNGQFRVLDIVAEGLSMALTLRSEYASVIKLSGGRVEGLVAQMHEHIEKLPNPPGGSTGRSR